MKTNNPADAWIHFFDRKRSMSTAKCMYPTTCLYSVSHYDGRLLNFFQLCLFNFIHNASCILQPCFCQHIFLIYILIFEEIFRFISKSWISKQVMTHINKTGSCFVPYSFESKPKK